MEKKSSYTKGQRIAAMVCVVIIALCFVVTLILNMINTEWAKTAGKIAIGFTLILPVLAWIYIWMIGHIFHKHTIADFDFGGVPTNHDPAIVADVKEEKSESSDK